MAPRKSTIANCICKDPDCNIPYGYCHCGCGQKTALAVRTNRRLFYVLGKPYRFIVGHGHNKPRSPIRYGIVDDEPVAYIPLTKGQWAIIDREDLDKVKGYFWQYKEGYATKAGGVFLHRFVMGCPLGKEVDHHNRNRLDCIKTNLRICSDAQNARNASLRKDNTSGFKGVGWVAGLNRWRVHIYVNRRMILVGYFAKYCLEEAARAYDEVAKRYHGEFARLNFPDWL